MAFPKTYVVSRRYRTIYIVVGGVVLGLLAALALQPFVSLSGASSWRTRSKLGKEQEKERSKTELMEAKVLMLEQTIHGLQLEVQHAQHALEEAESSQRDLETKLKEKDEQIQIIKHSLQNDTSPKEIQQCQQNELHEPWQPSSDRLALHPELGSFLQKIAINNEILVAISNKNYASPRGMLDSWAKAVKRAGIQNAMVVALDDETRSNMEKIEMPAFRMDVAIPESQKDSGSNHAVSALKFRILTPFLELGYSVLLSDVDVVHLQNPFPRLVRDCDVEAMSDGWDRYTAYGFDDVADDPSMGWARYAHSIRVFVFNSGYFYLRPTKATLHLLQKVIQRVETENGWDQALFNECIFFPNSPVNVDPAVTRRVMDIEVFMNSKTLFRYIRHDQTKFQKTIPVAVHVNYHSDKFDRMEAVWNYYIQGKKDALESLPDGSK